MTRLKIASVAVLAIAGLGTVGVITSGARRSGAPGHASYESTAARAPTRAVESKPAAKPVVPKVPEPQRDPRREALRVARLKHDGDWNLAPQVIPNLSDALRQPPFSFEVVLSQKDLLARDPNLIYYPLIYIHGRGALSFPKEDLDALRQHLEPGGGTLFADAACGSPAFDTTFHRFVATLLPGHKLEPIPHDDELYSERMGFDLSHCQSTRAAGGGRDFPQLEGVKINGHWAIIYSRLGIGCALDRHSGPECKSYTYDSAVKIAGNIVIYSTLP